MKTHTVTQANNHIVPLITLEETTEMSKILLFESLDVKSKHQLKEKLMSQNLSHIISIDNTDSLLVDIQKHQPAILILSIDSLSPSALDQLIKVNTECPVPIAVFAQQSSQQILKTAICAGVDSYVVDDVQEHRLPTIIDLAIARFEQFHNLTKELEQTKEKLSERKLIERAKGILMQQKNLSEDAAYVQMRKSAMNQGQSMAELSRRVISVFEMLD